MNFLAGTKFFFSFLPNSLAKNPGFLLLTGSFTPPKNFGFPPLVKRPPDGNVTFEFLSLGRFTRFTLVFTRFTLVFTRFTLVFTRFTLVLTRFMLVFTLVLTRFMLVFTLVFTRFVFTLVLTRLILKLALLTLLTAVLFTAVFVLTETRRFRANLTGS